MKTIMTDPLSETAMKSGRGGLQQDLKSGFKLTPGSTIEAKVLETETNGRLRIEFLGNTRVARLEAASSNQEMTRRPMISAGKTAVFRVLSVRPELVVAVERTAVEDKGADPTRSRSAEIQKGSSERLLSSPQAVRTGQSIQGRLVAVEGSLDPPSETSPGGYRAVVEVNGKQAPVWLDRPSAVGEQHLFKVLQAKPGPLLSHQGVVANASETLPVQTFNYRNDSLLFAKVLQVGSGDLNSSPHPPARVEIGGQVVSVLLERPLKEGETHMFRVISDKGLPLLTPVLGDERNVEMSAASLRTFLNAQQAGPHLYDSVIRSLTELGAHVNADSPVAGSVQHVLKLIQSITYGGEQVGKADFFDRFLALAGHTLEAGLAGKQGGASQSSIPAQENLKSLLIQLDGQLSEILEQGGGKDGGSDLQNLSNHAQGPVRNLLQHLLATQIVNTVAFHEEGSLAFEVPFSWAGQVETGRLTVRFKYEDESGDKKERESPTEIMVVFLLDLENMGPLRVDAYLKKEDRISVTVMAERLDVADYVRDRLSELGVNLADRGFKVERISCLQVKRERIQTETSPEVSQLIESDRMHIVA
ncbi:MAG: flagellar hook-length control protein FliK [Deltaproteobacteria bacterium]|nr:flagellar hook-length control protein FliK [Deltaproteobacteria bacterium]